MNQAEASQLLTIAATLDNRAVTAEAVQVWAGLLDDIDYSEAVDALKVHYRTSAKWMMPANVRDLVIAARREKRQAPNRELAAQRQWLLDRGIDYLKLEAGDEYTVATVMSLVRGDDSAPAGLKELAA